VKLINEQSNDLPFCNPCQSYHPVSQPCFDAATRPRAGKKDLVATARAFNTETANCGINPQKAHEWIEDLAREVERLNGEVARLTKELAEAYYEDCEICEQVIISENGDKVYTFIVCGRCWNEAQRKLSTARANAIDEAIDSAADSLRAIKDNFIPTNRAMEVAATALAALKQKDDGGRSG
jgi:hypothetical protein